MTRALTIVAAVAALAVSAAPASAGLLSSPLGLTTKPPPRGCASGDHFPSAILTGQVAKTSCSSEVKDGTSRKAPRGVVVLIGANDYGLLAKAERSNAPFTVDMVRAKARDNNPFTLD